MITLDDLDSPRFRRLTTVQRYIYWGATLIADDDGIVPVYKLSNRVLFDSDGITKEGLSSELFALSLHGFFDVYEDDEERYIQIQRWWDIQHLKRECYRPTRYPVGTRYLPRIVGLKSGPRSSLYDRGGNPLTEEEISSRMVLDKGRKDYDRKQKVKPEKVIPGKKKEVPLPYLENGDTHPNYL
jgi:hypothetical protein